MFKKQTDSIACPESHFPHSVGANTLKTNKLVKLVNSFTISQAQLTDGIVRLSNCEALESERIARNGRQT